MAVRITVFDNARPYELNFETETTAYQTLWKNLYIYLSTMEYAEEYDDEYDELHGDWLRKKFDEGGRIYIDECKWYRVERFEFEEEKGLK
jgi:hypothetical protein